MDRKSEDSLKSDEQIKSKHSEKLTDVLDDFQNIDEYMNRQQKETNFKEEESKKDSLMDNNNLNEKDEL